MSRFFKTWVTYEYDGEGSMQPKFSEEYKNLPPGVKTFWTWDPGRNMDAINEFVGIEDYLSERKRAKDLAKRVIELNEENSRLINLNAQLEEEKDELDTDVSILRIENEKLRASATPYDSSAAARIRLLEEENRRLTAERNEALAHAQELASRADTEHKNWYDHACKLADERNEALSARDNALDELDEQEAEIETLRAQRDLCDANLNAALDELAAQKNSIAHFDLALDTATAFGAEVVALRDALAKEQLKNLESALALAIRAEMDRLLSYGVSL